MKQFEIFGNLSLAITLLGHRHVYLEQDPYFFVQVMKQNRFILFVFDTNFRQIF